MNINFKILAFLMPMLLFAMSASAIDINDYGDFSSRSLIMSGQKNELSQEQKDLLLSKKLSPTTKCLIEQIKKKNNSNVELLLNSNVNPNKNYMAEYPIYIAAKENNFEAVKMLYEKGAKLDRGFNSELYEALRHKNSQMAQYLLDRKANIKYQDAITENTILYMALKNNMIPIAQQLIDKGIGADRKSVILIKKKKLEYLIKDRM
ncbi:MAG: ankyrin repeat domain-containing protein [Candidatus Gastranaerophilales bacterium]|nr:ankyrin repeat domain-containing protein [Candidatus Gastranaerophilales bacterium]